MRIVAEVELEVNIPTDRTSVNEVFAAVQSSLKEQGEELTQRIIEGYQDRIVGILCARSGPVAKKGLGSHLKKGGSGQKCRCRTFTRAGYWTDSRRLRGEDFTVHFKPAMIRCKGCGKRLTPVLEALELDPGQSSTGMLLQKAIEAIAETSYRRGSDQMETLTDTPVPKSTAHRWAADIDLPPEQQQAAPILSADGTGFKRQPGQRGEVRLVAGIDGNGNLRPIGVWAGTSWKNISKEVKDRLKGQSRLFLSDGERALEKWFESMAERSGRGHWHFTRDSGYALWRDGVSLEERKRLKDKLKDIIGIEIPESDVEMVDEEDKEQIDRRIEEAEQRLEKLREELQKRGYEKTVTYVKRAKRRLFSHLKLWKETGIVAPRTTSIVENVIRELVRRLKKVGWNWSDEGATRMGRIVMIRRYDQEKWKEYWARRINLRGRCKIKITQFKTRMAA